MPAPPRPARRMLPESQVVCKVVQVVLDRSKPVKRTVKTQFVRAPPGVTRNTCSIDFEEMKSTYSEELQDWVFTNAVMYAGKIVHATCLADMMKGQQGGGALERRCRHTGRAEGVRRPSLA